MAQCLSARYVGAEVIADRRVGRELRIKLPFHPHFGIGRQPAQFAAQTGEAFNYLTAVELLVPLVWSETSLLKRITLPEPNHATPLGVRYAGRSGKAVLSGGNTTTLGCQPFDLTEDEIPHWPPMS